MAKRLPSDAVEADVKAETKGLPKVDAEAADAEVEALKAKGWANVVRHPDGSIDCF